MTTKLPNDQQRFADGVGATQTSRDDFDSTNSPKYPARALIRETIYLEKPATDGAAATATAYTAAQQRRARQSGRILGAHFTPAGALTGDPTNNATLEVVSGDGAGGAGTVMASLTTTADMVAGHTQALAVTATSANQRFTAGGTIGFAITKGGTGVEVPLGTFAVDVEWEAADDGYKV